MGKQQTDVLRIKLETDGDGKLRASLAGVEGGLVSVENATERAQSKFLSLQSVMGSLAFGAFAVEVFNVNREFGSLRASLQTVTGSAANAQVQFRSLQQFAADTPFQLQEVINSFIKLKALGLTPSEEALRSYGNTSSAMSKSLDQLIEAVADATTGEFERLKEFGIKAKSEGDRVTFTFRGVQTTVKKTAAEIEKFIQDIGNKEFAGGMARQMETLDGAFSNLQDSIDGTIERLSRQSGLTGALEASTNASAEFIGSIDLDTLQAAGTAIGGLLVARTVGPALGVAAVEMVALTRGSLALNGALLAATLQMRATTAAATTMRGALALVGGPAGVALITAGSLAYLATREGEVEKSAKAAKEAVDLLAQASGSAVPKALADAEAKLKLAEANLKVAEAEAELEEENASISGMTGGGWVSPYTQRVMRLRLEINELREKMKETAPPTEETGDGIGKLGAAAASAAPKLDALAGIMFRLGLGEEQTMQATARAADIYRDTRTALDEYVRSVNEAAALLEAGQQNPDAPGGISKETYDRYVTVLNERYLAQKKFTDDSKTLAQEWSDVWTSAGNRFAAGIGDAVASAIIEQKNFGDAMRVAARGAIQQVISSLVELGIKQTALWALGETQAEASKNANVARAGQIAAANAPAAAATSIATYGTSAAVGIAALVAGFATAKALAGQAHDGIADIPSDGTWNLQRGERVVNQGDNARLSRMLDAFESGKLGGGGSVNFNIPTLDGQSAARVILNNRGLITRIIQDAYDARGARGGPVR